MCLNSHLTSESPKAKQYNFIVPSRRANLTELEKYSNLFENTVIYTYKDLLEKNEGTTTVKCNFRPTDYLLFESDNGHIHGAIITMKSLIRPSGWFIDCIAYSIPILTTHSNGAVLFAKMFPQFPFIDLSLVNDQEHLFNGICDIRNYDTRDYIRNHNRKIERRFKRLFNQQMSYLHEDSHE